MGMNGWLAGEYIASGIEEMRAGQRALRSSNEYSDVVDRLVAVRKELKEADDANASNLAMQHALLAALRNLDPKHPLIVNISLQERIKDAGEKALALTHNWDAARKAGETFKY